MRTFVLEQRPADDFDQIGDLLLDAFHELREALADGRHAVVVVHDADLACQTEPAAAAHAFALIGLVRALATEGVAEGWIVNAISATERGDELGTWLNHLAAQTALSGGLIRLGPAHLGRVPI